MSSDEKKIVDVIHHGPHRLQTSGSTEIQSQTISPVTVGTLLSDSDDDSRHEYADATDDRQGSQIMTSWLPWGYTL